MTQLSRLGNAFPLAFGVKATIDRIVYFVGVIGIVLIAIGFVVSLAMIPDLLRYLKLKSM